MKNRLSVLRLTAQLIKKPQLIKLNKEYHIANRRYYSDTSKAIVDFDLNRVEDPHVRASLLLQRHFGLRRE